MQETADDYAAYARAALPRYGFGPAAAVRLLSLSENGTFLVEEADRRVVVRVHRPGYHSKAAIESELLWMAAVRERCGIATPVLVPAQDGSSVVTATVGGSLRHVDAVSVIEGGTVIDFDDCGYSWYLLDLGSVVSWVEHEEATPGIVARWLRGYLEHRPLDDQDRAMVPAFVMMRRVMLTAWLASHPLSPPAQLFGHEYGLGTADLAARFLDDPSWFAVPAPE